MAGFSRDSKAAHEPVGVIHGRFQVLHNDHLRYLEAGRNRCGHLVVGITNPDPGVTGFDRADPERSRPSHNPLTYYERYRMVRAVLVECGWAPDSFSIVPFPVNRPELYAHYVPMDAVFFLTIYDEWGQKKLEMFQSMGLRTCVLWRKSPSEKGLSGTEIRDRIATGEPVDGLVPPAVAGIIEEIGLAARLRKRA